MDWISLVGVLALTTFIAAIAIALISKRKVKARLDDPDAPRSTLAKDVPSNAKPADV